MTLLDEGFDSDLVEIINDLPSFMTWKGVAIPVTLGDMLRTNDVAAEGIFNDRRLDAAARVSSFAGGVLPAVQDSVDIANPAHPNQDGNYYIEDRVDSPDGSGVVFTIVRKKDQNAAKK